MKLPEFSAGQGGGGGGTGEENHINKTLEWPHGRLSGTRACLGSEGGEGRTAHQNAAGELGSCGRPPPGKAWWESRDTWSYWRRRPLGRIGKATLQAVFSSADDSGVRHTVVTRPAAGAKGGQRSVGTQSCSSQLTRVCQASMVGGLRPFRA